MFQSWTRLFNKRFYVFFHFTLSCYRPKMSAVVEWKTGLGHEGVQMLLDKNNSVEWILGLQLGQRHIIRFSHLLMSVCFFSPWLRLGNCLAEGIPEVSWSQIGIHTSQTSAATATLSLVLPLSSPFLLKKRKHQVSDKKAIKMGQETTILGTSVPLLTNANIMLAKQVVPLKSSRQNKKLSWFKWLEFRQNWHGCHATGHPVWVC